MSSSYFPSVHVKTQAVFEISRKKRRTDFKDAEFYMSHHQKDAITEKGKVQAMFSNRHVTELSLQILFKRWRIVCRASK